MADAWVVHVHREPEWDEYTQQQAISGVLDRRTRCPRCNAVDSFVPVKNEDRTKVWPDGRRFTVTALRCLACGSRESIEADFRDRHKDTKRVAGTAGPEDGVIFTVTETDPRPPADAEAPEPRKR